MRGIFKFLCIFTMTLLLAMLMTVLPSFGAGSLEAMNEGFRGVKMGDDISQHSDLMPIEDNGKQIYYQRGEDKLKLGSVDLIDIHYNFFNGKCVGYLIRFAPSDFDTIKQILIDRYGRGTSIRDAYVKNYKHGDSKWYLYMIEHGLKIFLTISTQQYQKDVIVYKKELDAKAAKEDF